MIKWQDFYTSPKLSQHIKETKGILPDDHEYWKSPATMGWMDADDDQSFFPYSTFRMCQTNFNTIHPAVPHSVIEKDNPAFIPAYHILQDMCYAPYNNFFNLDFIKIYNVKNICNDFYSEKHGRIDDIEEFIKGALTKIKLDNKEITND